MLKVIKFSYLYILFVKVVFDLYFVIIFCYYFFENVLILVNDGLFFDFWYKSCFIKIYLLIWELSFNCFKLWFGVIFLEVNLVFFVIVIV